MPKQSAVQKRFLTEAAVRYHRSINGSPAAVRLEARGLADAVSPFRLGYVLDPMPGHEQYRGMLAIPYLRRSPAGWSVASLRFGCVQDGCPHEHHGKYNTVLGDRPRLFNTLALQSDTDTIGLCEGEPDTMSAELSGIRAVGVPGVECWKPHFRLPFLGYETVYVFADGDEAGTKFAHKIAKELPNAKVIPSALGEDVNSEMVRLGRDHILRKVGRA
jgi:Toprim-like